MIFMQVNVRCFFHTNTIISLGTLSIRQSCIFLWSCSRCCKDRSGEMALCSDIIFFVRVSGGVTVIPTYWFHDPNWEVKLLGIPASLFLAGNRIALWALSRICIGVTAFPGKEHDRSIMSVSYIQQDLKGSANSVRTLRLSSRNYTGKIQFRWWVTHWTPKPIVQSYVWYVL